jgi:hypothetical protein
MWFLKPYIFTGGCLPGILGASCCGSMSSVAVVSESMPIVLRGAKKLQADTPFRSNLTAADGD